MQTKKYTPMIQQYLEVKKKYQDTIVLYRLGDFYEMFFEDAKLASNILDIALTARGKNDNAIPMCGVPHHSATSYIQKLVNEGHKVAIVEQLEEPTAGKIVERDVVRIVTPGTIFSDDDSKQVNYLLAIHDTKFSFVLVYLDHYSGELFTREIQRDKELLSSYINDQVKEIIIKADFGFKEAFRYKPYSVVSENVDISAYRYLNPYDDLGIMVAFEIMINYLIYTQKTTIQHLQVMNKIVENQYLLIDQATKKNLELLTSTKSKKYSLWGFLDHCNTAMGSRLLMKWVEYPLIDLNAINKRLDIIEKLKSNVFLQHELKNHFNNIYDIKRIFAKISYENVSPKELLKLKDTLMAAPKILKDFSEIKSYDVNTCEEILHELTNALKDEVPTFIKDGNVFKDEYHQELYEYRLIQQDGDKYILELEAKEKERTQIKNLKIGYNRIFGHYIEISKGQISNVKEDFGYIRKQTLANCERYVSLELKEIEEKLLTAKDKIIELELVLYQKLLHFIMQFQQPLMQLAQILSEIDCYCALATVSNNYGYVRPTFGEYVDIKAGRHPILETLMPNQQYISNDYNTSHEQFMILTGPNMGGKSTYMRQNALMCIMGQIGCFVSAETAQLKVFTKIFTRMGASDDILSAQSTFMVEMSEANYALRNADQDSLILFDEIGRGTSTYDGMSLAWGMIEYIHYNLHATTIFSTHYHELTQLGSIEGIENYYVEVHEENDHVTFLYKVKKGYIDKSYGINVAKLAKLPTTLINRSKELLQQLQKEEVSIASSPTVIKTEDSKLQQLINEADINTMSPLEALLFVVKLKEYCDNE